MWHFILVFVCDVQLFQAVFVSSMFAYESKFKCFYNQSNKNTYFLPFCFHFFLSNDFEWNILWISLQRDVFVTLHTPHISFSHYNPCSLIHHRLIDMLVCIHILFRSDSMLYSCMRCLRKKLTTNKFLTHVVFVVSSSKPPLFCAVEVSCMYAGF